MEIRQGPPSPHPLGLYDDTDLSPTSGTVSLLIYSLGRWGQSQRSPLGPWPADHGLIVVSACQFHFCTGECHIPSSEFALFSAVLARLLNPIS